MWWWFERIWPHSFSTLCKHVLGHSEVLSAVNTQETCRLMFLNALSISTDFMNIPRLCGCAVRREVCLCETTLCLSWKCILSVSISICLNTMFQLISPFKHNLWKRTTIFWWQTRQFFYIQETESNILLIAPRFPQKNAQLLAVVALWETLWTLWNALYNIFLIFGPSLKLEQILYIKLFLSLCKKRIGLCQHISYDCWSASWKQ